LRTNGESDKVATVIVPAFIPKGQDVTQAVTTSAFEPVWEVLSALRDQDERLADEVDALRFNLGDAKRLDASFERLFLDVPAEVGAEFVSAFNARLVREVGLTPQTQIRIGRASSPKVRDDSPSSVQRIDRGLDPLGLEALQRFVDRTGHSKVPEGHQEEGFGLADWLEGTLAAIERHAYGNPGRYFEFEDADSFRRSMRALDLDRQQYPALVAELDPLDSLARFWDVVVAGKFPPELQSEQSVSAEDFPRGADWDSTTLEDGEKWDKVDGYVKYEGAWSYWKHGYDHVLEQIRPEGHQEKFNAALVALSVLREAEALSEGIAEPRRADFRLGVIEGIHELGLEGCLIDQVEQRFRGNADRIAAYVKGWDFGKTQRQDSAGVVRVGVGDDPFLP